MKTFSAPSFFDKLNKLLTGIKQVELHTSTHTHRFTGGVELDYWLKSFPRPELETNCLLSVIDSGPHAVPPET